MYGYIYETTNLIDGKKYIGKSAHSEFNKDYHGSGVFIKKAIKKYGAKNFKTILIEECDSLEELNEKEKYWIKYYNATTNSNYYNMTPGGDGGWYYDRKTHPHSGFTKDSKHTPETKQKMKDHHWSKTGKYSPKNRTYSKEELDKFRSNHWSKLGLSVWNKGKKIPKEKMTENQRRACEIFPSNNKGSKWMNKDGISKRVHGDKIQQFLDEGFKFGRI